jgi:hypothetical protein
MDKLKPCPFCGGNGKMVRRERDGFDNVFICCESCGASTGIFSVRRGMIPPRAKITDYCFDPVVRAWNRRAE